MRKPYRLEIVYEDRDLIVIEKPAGLLTMHPRRDQEATAAVYLTDYLRKGYAYAKPRAWVVHRLDRDTSGLLIFAKSEEIREKIQENWKSVKKTYVAIVCGIMPQDSGAFFSYLTENNDQYVHSVEDPEQGKASHTLYEVIARAKKKTAVRIRLLTGRKNQIRAHFTEAGFPILGDPKYGKIQGVKSPHCARMCLHAQSLRFAHPVTGEMLSFESALPSVFSCIESWTQVK